MSQTIYKTRKGSIVSTGSGSAGAIPVANINGKIDNTWLEGFGNKRIEEGSNVILASDAKTATSTVYFDQEYPTLPKVYLSLRTASWNAKNTAGTLVVTTITTAWFRVTAIVNTDDMDTGWDISNPISFDWFSVGEFDTE